MKKRVFPLIALSTLALCQSASAMEAATWDLRGNVPEGLSPKNLTVMEATAEGLYIQTERDGFLALPSLPVRADTLVITSTTVDPTEIALIWREPNQTEGEYYQQNIKLPTGDAQDAVIPLHLTDTWTPDPQFIGLAVPAGSELLIETLTWREYSFTEKLWNGFLSFWTPDTFTLYSINFLWGPLIGSTPEARATLFENLPPPAWSATRVFYGLFLIAALIGGIWYVAKPVGGKRRLLTILAISGACLWIVFDARMTQEVLNYVLHDWKTYILAAPGERELRTHRGLYDTLNEIDELLGEDPSYVLLENDLGAYFANARYKLYPAKPMTPEDRGDATAWVILGMPDVSVQSGGALMMRDGTVLSPRGELVKQFEDYSFFYRALP